MARIKICGLRRPEDAQYVNDAHPDYAGFILSDGYRRSVDVATACAISDLLAEDIQRVGVFVDEPSEAVNSVADAVGLDYVQLHGKESPDYCRSINRPVIKVLRPDDFGRADDYADCTAYLLFDSGTGTGKVFDWSQLPQTDRDFFLAGGLSAENVADAIGALHPFAVDVSSAVESDGYKDKDKIKIFTDIVRSII